MASSHIKKSLVMQEWSNGEDKGKRRDATDTRERERERESAWSQEEIRIRLQLAHDELYHL